MISMMTAHVYCNTHSLCLKIFSPSESAIQTHVKAQIQDDEDAWDSDSDTSESSDNEGDKKKEDKGEQDKKDEQAEEQEKKPDVAEPNEGKSEEIKSSQDEKAPSAPAKLATECSGKVNQARSQQAAAVKARQVGVMSYCAVCCINIYTVIHIKILYDFACSTSKISKVLSCLCLILWLFWFWF